MKCYSLVAFFFVLCFSTATGVTGQETKNNPVFSGWYADPEGIVFGDKYWIYPTYSAPYEDQVFLDAFSSPDLVNWEYHQKIIDTSKVKWAHKAMWAPSIVKKGDKYYLFFSANDIQTDQEEGGIGVAVASNSGGPYKDHIGRSLIGKFYKGAKPIDQFSIQR